MPQVCLNMVQVILVMFQAPIVGWNVWDSDLGLGTWGVGFRVWGRKVWVRV